MIFGEDYFLSLIDKYFPQEGQGVIIGRGDDCALIEGGRLAVSSDLFLEGVHFDLSYFSLADVGYKALAVNLSDLAGVGAWPKFFCLQLIWPRAWSLDLSEELIQGLALLSKEYKLNLIGGDISAGDSLGLAITIWGEVGNRFLSRKIAEVGDWVFYLGELGLAKVGFNVLQQKKEGYFFSKKAHLRPKPLVAEGLLISSTKVKSLMDVSDGLARDIFRLLPQGLGLELKKEPDFHSEVIAFCQQHDLSCLSFALEGGEDYCLLGVVSPKDWQGLKKKLPQVKILGEVIDRAGIFFKQKEVSLTGFDHFPLK